MKNTALVLSYSFVATHIIILIIFAIEKTLFSDFYGAFWAWDGGQWTFNIFSAVWLLVACATSALTLFFGIKEKMVLSYGLGATAGVFLGIFIYMLNLVILD